MSTEYRQEGDYLVVQSKVDCMGGLSLLYRTLWSVSTDQRRIVWARAELGIGSISLELSSGPTPMDHIAAVRRFAATLPGEMMTVDPRIVDVSDGFRSVFLATRKEGCEVFVDEASARFWAGTPSSVKKVSLRSASSALKTDEETIIESAVTATRIAWLEMRACVSLLRGAESIGKRFREAGISQDVVMTDTTGVSTTRRA